MIKGIVSRSVRKFIFEFFSLFEENARGAHGTDVLLNVLWEKYIRQMQIAENIFAFLPYEEGKVRSAILQIKTTGNPLIIENIVKEIWSAFLPEVSRLTELYGFSPSIVPIPLYIGKQKEKGFNHAEKIAEAFSNVSHYPLLTHVVTKNRDTKRQHDLSKKEREWNLKDAFSVTENANIEGKDFLLIDDVTTTGETMLEVLYTLRRAGARLVVGVALAH